MAEGLPDFPYYADPLADGCFEQKDITCEVCRQQREWAYVGVMYAEEEPENVCPWCVSNARAAAKYEGTFQDVHFSETASAESIEAVLTQTPSVATWNPIHWPDHCGECCQYIGNFAFERTAALTNTTTVQNDLMEIGSKTRMKPDEILIWAQGGSICLRLFRCVVCDSYRLALDLD